MSLPFTVESTISDETPALKRVVKRSMHEWIELRDRSMKRNKNP
jgi:hypothetical protein